MNGSRGSDHGAAGRVLVLGGAVDGVGAIWPLQRARPYSGGSAMNLYFLFWPVTAMATPRAMNTLPEKYR